MSTTQLAEKVSLAETVAAFLDAMIDQGIDTRDEIVADGHLHRIHVEGDRKGSRNAWYCLHYDERPAGTFGCNKRHGDHKFQWQADRNATPWTQEERRAWADRVARERADKQAAEKERHEKSARIANSVWENAGDATGEHPYLKAKGVKAHGLKVGKWFKVNTETGDARLISDNALLVPISDRKRKIHSLQAIFPGKMAALGDRNKDYLADGAKRGLFHTIGKPIMHEGRPVFVLCEGYATGASIHECTGHLVLVCFDSSNLVAVAESLRSGLAEVGKEAVIVLAADNDRWTTKPVENPGVHFAQRAAKAVKGLLVVPEFRALDGEPTDFNDLHQIEGTEAVRKAFELALNPSTPASPEENAIAENDNEPLAGVTFPDSEENGFRVLGHSGAGTGSKRYYIYQFEINQIIAKSASELASNAGLLEIAPIQFWEGLYPNPRGGISIAACADWIMKLARSRGVFDPSRTRGRGLWPDAGRLVFHQGNRLLVDGKPFRLDEIASDYVYESGAPMPLPSAEMLTAEEGYELIGTARRFRWESLGAGDLLAGWCFLAPICGALKWRPHVWITGGAGLGKSTLIERFMSKLMPEHWPALFQNSTEAGIRQTLGCDARPVLNDEFEGNTEAERKRSEAILAMIRQSSTDSNSVVARGTIGGKAINFSVRSMFCLSSIGVNLSRQADIDRITRLDLSKNTPSQWDKLERELDAIEADHELSRRIFARAICLLPVIMQSVKVFSRVAGQALGRQRDGDQFGTLMAGVWCLINGAAPSEVEAVKFLSQYDLSVFGAGDSDDFDDSQASLDVVLGAVISNGLPAGIKATVAQLIDHAVNGVQTNYGVSSSEAANALAMHGIRQAPKGRKMILFAKSHQELVGLVRNTDFEVALTDRLGRLPGAVHSKQGSKTAGDLPEKADFAKNLRRYVAVPFSLCLPQNEESNDNPLY
ncbi:TPA: toprim domain-containing protein [Klebsiella michiganensis]|nr:toprim domain-containing protein [Klebsiella michiganensis]